MPVNRARWYLGIGGHISVRKKASITVGCLALGIATAAVVLYFVAWVFGENAESRREVYVHAVAYIYTAPERCATVEAHKWNHLLRLNRDVTFKPINRARIKRRPVCVKPYKKLKKLVYRRIRKCSGGTPSTNRCLGRRMAAKRGWTGSQWQCLDTLWGTRESGWDHKNVNGGAGSGGANGIPQRLGNGPLPAGWSNSPRMQIAWGLDYIKHRYGSPCAALSHSYSSNWY